MGGILVKTLFSILSKIAFSMCGEAVLKAIIFKLLEMAAKHTKTKFDDKLLEQIKENYEEREA